jgi:hypothetical protein
MGLAKKAVGMRLRQVEPSLEHLRRGFELLRELGVAAAKGRGATVKELQKDARRGRVAKPAMVKEEGQRW